MVTRSYPSLGLQINNLQLLGQLSSQTAPTGVKDLTAHVAVGPMQQVAAPLKVDFDQHDVEHIDDYEDLELNIIETQQLMMTKFVDNVEHELEELARQQGIVVPPSTESTEPLLAPKLSYAFYEGEAVSVFMRVDHDPVLKQQANGLSDALAGMSDALPSSLTVAVPTAEFATSVGKELSKQVKGSVIPSTGGKVPNLDEFVVKCGDLSAVIDLAKTKLNQFKSAAKQADALFANFAPDAGRFGDHVVNMLAQLEPIFLASSNMLKLPVKYRIALTTNLSNMLKGSGAAESVTTQITAMFDVIDKANTTINEVRKRLVKTSEQSKTASASYKAVFTQSSQIVALSRSPGTLGPSVTNLTTFVEALQTRLDQAAGSLGSLAAGAVVVTQNPDQLVDATASYTKFNGLFGQLLPLIDPMVTQAKQIPPRVDTLYMALKSVFGDMQTLFNATQNIVLTCRKAEAQVVSADVFRGLCARINSAVAPFESFLAQLQPDSVPAPTIGPIPGPSPTNPIPKSPALIAKTANTALGGAPFDIITSLIGPKIFEAINAKLESFAKISELDSQLATLNAIKQSTVKANFDKFNGAITGLVGALDPKVASAANPNAAAINPLLDELKAKTFVTVVQSVEMAMTGAIKPAAA